MEIGNPLGLYAFLALIPLIIIYLMRPKPLEKIIPSLMFLLRDKKDLTQRSFLRKLIRNLLLILQLLALSLIAFAVASPFLQTSRSVTSQNTVLVIDASASSQTLDGGMTRFQREIDAAQDYLEGKISIVLAAETPQTLLEDSTREHARSVLLSLEPRDTETNLEAALSQAEAILGKRTGRIVVFSDFLVADSNELLKVKRLISAQGIEVRFVSSWSEAVNVGIVRLEVGKHTTVATIQNFNDAAAEVSAILVKGKDVLAERPITLTAHSSESVSFDTPTDLSEIRITAEDDFPLDNVVYLSTPSKKQIDALIITNAQKNSISTALASSKDIVLTRNEPPIVNAISSNDVIILSDVDSNLLLPGTLEEIARWVEQGHSAIIAAQPMMSSLGAGWLLPVELVGDANTTSACVTVFTSFTKQFEGDPCFTTAKSYFTALPKNGTISVVEAGDGSPLVATATRGKGTMVYYGIMDDKSDFKKQTAYPIFWNDLMNSLVKLGDVQDYNFKMSEKPLIDKVGVYNTEGKKIAVNLLSEFESEVSRESIAISDETFESGIGTETVKIDLVTSLLIAALAIIIFEIVYLKSRGDL